MENLTNYESRAKVAAQIVQHVLVNELKLAPPGDFVLTERNGLVWLIARMDVLSLGRNIDIYADKKTVHHLSTALKGIYVGLANHTGLRYAMLLSPKPRLPKLVEFPGFEPDVFRIGMSLRDEIRLTGDEVQNIIIAGPPGGGKSNLLKLLGHTMRMGGWKLYLADPQAHTFNPDIWNELAAVPVAGSLDEVRTLLAQMDAERLNRQAQFRAVAKGGVSPENLAAYNAIASEPMPRFALLFDEANTWLKQVLDQVTDLARQIRKFGGSIVLAGHDWHSADIPRSLSAQFATRIALTSNDDTAARVVLNNQRWGLWTVNKPAGRAVIRNPKFGFRPVQFYRVTPEMEREWLANLQSSPALTKFEQQVIETSLSAFNGSLPIVKVADTLGVTAHRIRTLAESWERRGWLDKPADAVSSRTVTEKLLILAGISRTGAQVTQAHTGAAQVA
jgi:hypothetical protein